MGGYGSGRPGLYPYTTGDALFLRVREVLRSCVPAGIISWRAGGDPAGSVTVSVGQPYEGMPNGWGWARDVAVEWREREGETPWEDRSAALRLISRPQPFGGVRWWWACPHCRTRRELLYKLGRSRWACRGCLRLPYHTQRMRSHDRADRRLQRLAKRLGVTEAGDVSAVDVLDWTPDRPPRMRERTYQRLVAQWEDTAYRGASDTLARFSRILGNLQ